MAKKGIAVRIAIGRPKAPSDLGAPSGLEAAVGAKKRAPAEVPTPGEEDEDEDQESPDTGEDDDQDQDEDDQGGGSPGGAVPPSPEAVHYHDDLQRCDGCTHFGQDSYCEVLQRNVQAEGACASYDALEQGGGGEYGGEYGGGGGGYPGEQEMPYGAG
jgi:hypothetical protein